LAGSNASYREPRGLPVGVQVVHDEHDAFGVRVVDAEQLVDLVRPVDPGPPLAGVDPAPAGEGFDPHEDRAGSVTDVLRVLLQIVSGAGGDRVADVSRELVRLLVHAHRRRRRIVRAMVDLQHVFHAGHELPAGVRRDRPALLQMRAKPPFLRTRPIVEWSSGGIPSVSTTCFSSSRSDHRS